MRMFKLLETTLLSLFSPAFAVLSWVDELFRLGLGFSAAASGRVFVEISGERIFNERRWRESDEFAVSDSTWFSFSDNRADTFSKTWVFQLYVRRVLLSFFTQRMKAKERLNATGFSLASDSSIEPEA